MKIYHPETKELFGTIEIVKNDAFPKDKFESKVLNDYPDWHATEHEAEQRIQNDLNQMYLDIFFNREEELSEERHWNNMATSAERLSC